jgi:hypothetical protein
MRFAFASLALASLVAGGSARAEDRPRLFALIIGNNTPLAGSGYEPLAYADDDALRFAELFRGLGADVTLLTAPDQETLERMPEASSLAEAPTRDRVLHAMDRIARELQQAPRSELYFVYSGHGSVSSANAFIHLLDGPFSRTDLREQVLRRIGGARAHVIIDSCNSYFLVSSRGERVAVSEEETLDRFPEVGFLLSTSDAREVHEWSGYHAGVFSHQVIGALQGAADVDGDGVVTYPEIHAYIIAANSAVTDARARIHPFVRYPVVQGEALIDLRGGQLASLVLPKDLEGHLWLTDDRGTRMLDAHKPRGLELHLAMPRRKSLWLSVGDQTYAVRSNGALVLASAQGTEDARARGSIADELRSKLFARPLTPDFVAGLEASMRAPSQAIVLRASPNPYWLDDPMTLGLIGAGSAGIVFGVVASLAFASASNDANARPVTAETEHARSRAENWRGAMVAGFASGAALVAAGVLRAVFTDGPRHHEGD